MSHVPLKTYLRTFRRKAGLSQNDVAFLLGKKDKKRGTSVGRHEGGDRMPILETALAYEIILGVSIRELYAGKHRAILVKTRVRAAVLVETLRNSRCRSVKRRDRKIVLLLRLIDESSS